MVPKESGMYRKTRLHSPFQHLWICSGQIEKLHSRFNKTRTHPRMWRSGDIRAKPFGASEFIVEF